MRKIVITLYRYDELSAEAQFNAYYHFIPVELEDMTRSEFIEEVTNGNYEFTEEGKFF